MKNKLTFDNEFADREFVIATVSRQKNSIKPLAEFTLAVSRTAENLKKGLMEIDEMYPDQGMLFCFPEYKKHSFWMKDTNIPLDCIFLDKEYRVVGIIHNMVPKSTYSRSIAANSFYAIEIMGGLAEKYGIKLRHYVSIKHLQEE